MTGIDTVADVRDALHSAGAEGVRIAGAGSWLHAGTASDAARRLDTRGLRGVVEYVPGDFTITVRAGTSLQEIAEVTAAEGQWLAMDPVAVADSTIGATIATASAGSLALGFGTPRDQILGCTLVTGAGNTVNAGGRVVKNVAGFDLVRLNTGAWGSLGVITEVSLRLRAMPTEDVTIAMDIRDDAVAARQWLRATSHLPMAAVIVCARTARRMGLGDEATLLLRFGGNSQFAAAAVRDAGSLGRAIVIDSPWPALSTPDDSWMLEARVSLRPSRMADAWSSFDRLCDTERLLQVYDVGRGVVRLTGADAGPVAAIQTWAAAAGATLIVERGLQQGTAAHVSDAQSALRDRIRAAFDPRGILNPGIMDGFT